MGIEYPVGNTAFRGGGRRRRAWPSLPAEQDAADFPFGPITWLDYTRPANSWFNQMGWAVWLGDSLTVTLDPLYVSEIDWTTGWRLPLVDVYKAYLSGVVVGWAGPDETGFHEYRIGYNMVNSEMGHLYYNTLGNHMVKLRSYITGRG